jgi:D-beta-D-heptose 7-phosphate kinase/D-beta-D-heptose 1-phosphate adenosyltransferase
MIPTFISFLKMNRDFSLSKSTKKTFGFPNVFHATEQELWPWYNGAEIRGLVSTMSREKIVDLNKLLQILAEARLNKNRIVFTNGCFDLLHAGHIQYLEDARNLGDLLVVGLNSDRSVNELKGKQRPILNQEERARILAGLASVSYITIFDEITPLELIKALLPDVLVKGGDWGTHQIVGRGEVEAAGGVCLSLPFAAGQSTTSIIERVLERCGLKPGN